jgi:hypothetical protein
MEIEIIRRRYAMSGPNNKAPWIDRFWPLLLIAFGVTFISTFVLFHPHF